MIMGGKKCLGSAFRPDQVFRHSPGDAQARRNVLVPRPISSRMTRLSEVAWRKYIRGLAHLHHEGALPPRQIVGLAPTRGEYPVGSTDHRAFRRNKSNRSCANSTIKSHLPHISGFPRHIGAGKNDQAADACYPRSASFGT